MPEADGHWNPYPTGLAIQTLIFLAAGLLNVAAIVVGWVSDGPSLWMIGWSVLAGICFGSACHAFRAWRSACLRHAFWQWVEARTIEEFKSAPDKLFGVLLDPHRYDVVEHWFKKPEGAGHA